jgi:outer membrane protein assembly factor BamB
MKSPICMTHKKQTTLFSIAGLMLAIAPLWLTLAANAQSSNPSPADWTQFHRDNMQRWNPYETALGINNVGGLELQWSKLIRLFSQSSPAVANGVTYVGSFNGNLYAFDAKTGKQLWFYATGAGVFRSSPAVANGVVYIQNSNGILDAVNATTGVLLWSYTVSDVNSVTSNSSPAVAQDVVYIGGKNNLYALNAATGALLWSYTTGGIVASSPSVVNGVVYFGSDDANVYALSASTGDLLWKYATRGAVESGPAVVDGVVYVGSVDNNVYALAAGTGSLVWSYATQSFVYSSPAVANGVVYFGSRDNDVHALNATTGSLKWKFGTGDHIDSSPAVANGVVYIGSSDGNLYALNAGTGAKLWSYYTGSGIISSPTVVNGFVYIPALDHLDAFTVKSADLFLRIQPTPTTVHQGDLLTYAFPMWNLGPDNTDLEVLNTQVPAGTTFDYIRISGTPGLGTCTTPPYGGTGQIVCHENASMAPNTTWTVRLTVKVTALAGTVITENAATMSDTPDPNLANNTATLSIKVQ